MSAARQGAPVLQVRDLAVHHGSRVALAGVDLDVGPGELVALVGRNGAGKSSLLGALAGLLAHHGAVRWHLPAHSVACVPQRASPRWDLPLDVEQVVASGRLGARRWWRRPPREDRALVHGAMERLGVDDLARRPVQALSGGQAQRVLLARALAQQPRALLLDEPYDGLDGPSTAVMHRVLGELTDDGVCVVAAVHELDVVRRRYHRAVALDGEVLADGPPERVLADAELPRLFGWESAA